MMTQKKKKTLAAAGAVALAAIIALGGTFAWQAISQTALNEAAATLNPGGRLHDDFDGRNKDVYVENFTDDGTAIFARVRLDEYMEIGQGAGADVDNQAESVIAGATLGDKTSWTTRLPSGSTLVNEEGDAYWTWNMGGQTTYMPTFNKNKDSLQADINGTYDGLSSDDDIHYDDYVDYSDPENATKEADAYYDADTNDADEGNGTGNGAGGTIDVNYTAVNEEHTATLTDTATVITMDEWLLLDGDARIGNFWVWDEDGWAYWAQPIESGEATGLLLDEIVHANPPSDSWYYGINVVGQFVTADDIGFLNGTGFYDTDAGAAPTANAELLLETITGTDIPDATVSVSTANNATSVETGESMQFSAVVTKGANAVDTPAITWSVSGEEDMGNTTIDASSGLLSVSADETAESLTVTATYMDGETACTGSFTLTVIDPNVLVVTASSETVYPGSQSEAFYVESEESVTWSISGQESDDTYIQTDGRLVVGVDEAASEITATATAGDKTGSKTISVVSAPIPDGTLDWQQTIINGLDNGELGDTSAPLEVTIDGIEWIVGYRQGDRALLVAADVDTAAGARQFDAGEDETGYDTWRSSGIRAYLNGEWLDDKPILDQYALEADIRSSCNDSLPDSQTIETIDRIFIPSSSDLGGRIGTNKTTSPDFGFKVFLEDTACSENYWTRTTGATGAFIDNNSWVYDPNTAYLRPCLWISLNSLGG